jgi:pyruvate/2-oxoglutarate dehydrogenase complex dihydrolipoamide dehydrogenase (E3) component
MLVLSGAEYVSHYDLIVIGSGPAGRRAAVQAA